MNNSSLICRHRLKSNGLFVPDYAAGKTVSKANESFFALFTIVFRIDINLDIWVALISVNIKTRKHLNSVKSIAALAD